LAYLIKAIVGFEGELIFDTKKPDGTPANCWMFRGSPHWVGSPEYRWKKEFAGPINGASIILSSDRAASGFRF